MDLPEEKGTYILIAQVSRMKRLAVGRLGNFNLAPGFYAYVGSAFGSGGLRARIGHHLESTAEPHWHVDYLLQIALPVELWHSTATGKLEQHWADYSRIRNCFTCPFLDLAPQIAIGAGPVIYSVPSTSLLSNGLSGRSGRPSKVPGY